jgi:hypothetical protein
MSSVLLERPPTSLAPDRVRRPATLAAVTPGAATPRRVVVHGDFDCPWSYLAYRRAAVLAAAGVEIDWRAVERDPRVAWHTRPPGRISELREDMDRVLASLLPGELLPYDLAGFVPGTRATVAAYAESYVAGVADSVRAVMFESFWMHGIDIGDAHVLRTLLADHLRSSASPCEAVREWGYSVDVTGGPISSAAWRLVGSWATEWRDSGREITPAVQVPGSPPIHGVDAVAWLGDQLTALGLAPNLPPSLAEQPPDGRELPALGWITEQGGRWLGRCQRASAAVRHVAG